jgi:putative transposase
MTWRVVMLAVPLKLGVYWRSLKMLLNAAIILERSAHLRADPYERSERRNGYGNALKDRSFHSTGGSLALRVPQTRECDEPFQPSMLESGSRVDRALKVAIAEMYIQGVSTRRVTKVLEKLCGLEVTSTQVSRLTAQLDETFKQWRERPLPEIAHLIVDATYVKVRINGSVCDCAVLTAMGVRREDGKRMILGVSAALSEAEVHWRACFVSLKERGDRHPRLSHLRCPRRPEGFTQSGLQCQSMAALSVPSPAKRTGLRA